MSYQSNGFDYDAFARRDGRMSASNQRRYSQVQRPSSEELARYSAANYTSRKTKTSRRFGLNCKYVLIAVAAAVVLLLVIPGVMLGFSARQAMDDARLLMNQGSTFASQIQAGDVEGARRTAANLDSVAKQLDENVNSLLWKPLVAIPVYGEDVRSVRRLAHVASELSSQVLVPMAQGLPVENARPFVDDAINIPFLQAVLDPIANASESIQECAWTINSRPDPHITQLQQPFQTVKSLLGALDEVSGYAGDLSQMLPSLLGAEGPRTYLLVAFGESELRSTGGFPGSTGLMTVDNGRLDVGTMDAPAMTFVTAEDEVIPLTDEEAFLFGSRAGEYFYDAGYNPHFPRAAEIMKSIWDANGREPVDGMICLDPVFLQHVMELTGSITTSDGVVVDGTNAAEMLMKNIYLMYSAESFEEEAALSGQNPIMVGEARQNGFFSEVASLALEKFFESIGSVDMLQAVQILGEAISDKRFYMWMVDPQEQALIEKLDAACALSFDEAQPELGIYVSTTLGTKGNWFVVAETTFSEGAKNSDGSTSYAVTTKISNTLKAEDAQALPTILTNPEDYASARIRERGEAVLDVYLFAPMGGSISNMQIDGDFAAEDMFDDMGGWYTRPRAEKMAQATYNGYEVWYGVTAIPCWDSTTFTYTVTTSPKAVKPLVLDATPVAQS